MPRRKRPAQPDWPDTYMIGVARAADQAMEEVLEEDRALRDEGVEPPNGRSR